MTTAGARASSAVVPVGVGTAIRWASASQVARQGVQLVTMTILARTLTPSDFGLMTIALVVIGFVTLFRDMSVGSAVIQHVDVSPAWLSTVFWIACATGVAVLVATLLLAGMISSIFGDLRLSDLLMALAPSYLIGALGVVHQGLLEREMKFSLVARVEAASAVGGSAIAIALAVSGAGVWALVGQSLASSAIGAALLWRVVPWRPRFSARIAHARAGGTFGSALTVFNIVNYFGRNGDYFLIGKFLGAAALGEYTVAYRLMLVPLQLVTSVTNRVLFPTLSRLRASQPAAVAPLYLSAVGAIAFVASPISLGLAATSDRLIPILLGPGWEDAIPVAILLSVVGMLQAVGATIGPVFLATGALKRLVAWGSLSTFIVVLGFIVGIPSGIIGVAASYVLTSGLLLAPSLSVALEPLGVSAADVARVIFRPIAIAGVMSACVVVVDRVLERAPDLPVLAADMLLGVIVYTALSLIVNRRQAGDVIRRIVPW